MEEKDLVAAVRQRLKAEGPAVRYSIDVERCAEGTSRVQVCERVEAVTLTARDYDVLGFLAIARRLTADQLIALSFPGRHITIAYRRLAMLAAARPGGGGYVRQDFFFGARQERAKVAAWAVTNDGYNAVAPLLPYLRAYSTTPAVVANLQHDLWLNDLFVAMATARGAPVSPGDLPFRWLCDTDRPIAFRTLDDNAAFKTNLLRPDAIVELPFAQRRIFIEAERGTHTISPMSTMNAGATTMKARRYGLFVAAPIGAEAQTTAYRSTFPDGYRPELLFLVHSEWRRVHVLEALQAEHAKDANPPDFPVHVMTFDKARELLTSALPAGWTPAFSVARPRAQARPAAEKSVAATGLKPAPRARVRVGDAQLLKDGFNVLLDELKSRGGTKDLRAEVRSTVRKTREFIVWLVEGAAAGSSKTWSGAEKRQTRPTVAPSDEGNRKSG
ncbi:replication-relaxation family protein [Anaeromyxobacter oryzisoli]|uniref:replication-relaxation family protein n=1 Tax=Anaeromyxobacter oryzisoli TaxID=2925408 RepID=UPI001F584B00|nr:replication-relaxation family protein [Anaeromyxobacter sp. SG63]